MSKIEKKSAKHKASKVTYKRHHKQKELAQSEESLQKTSQTER